jgi:hypothetical protein
MSLTVRDMAPSVGLTLAIMVVIAAAAIWTYGSTRRHDATTP